MTVTPHHLMRNPYRVLLTLKIKMMGNKNKKKEEEKAFEIFEVGRPLRSRYRKYTKLEDLELCSKRTMTPAERRNSSFIIHLLCLIVLINLRSFEKITD